MSEARRILRAVDEESAWDSYRKLRNPQAEPALPAQPVPQHSIADLIDDAEESGVQFYNDMVRAAHVTQKNPQASSTCAAVARSVDNLLKWMEPIKAEVEKIVTSTPYHLKK